MKTLTSSFLALLLLISAPTISFAQELPKFDLQNLVGSWRLHKANGDTDDIRNIKISENEGFYTVEYSFINRYESNTSTLPDEPTTVFPNTGDITIKNDTIIFYTKHSKSYIVPNGSKGHYEALLMVYHYTFVLTLVNGKLKGTAKCTRYLWATGNSDYPSVMKALADDAGKVYNDCSSGNCWTENVYFTKY